MAAAAAAEDVVMPVDFFDIDSFNLDDFDFDLAADEFCDAYATFVADANNKGGAAAAAPGGWLPGSGIDGITGSSSEGSSSPDSGVTDGPLAGEGSKTMSAFVCDLERFLMEDDGGVFDEVAACPGGEQLPEEELSVDDYFGDLLVTFDNGATAVEDAARSNPDEESLGAREDDESTSRKRARHKFKGITMTCSWAELAVMRKYLAPMQVLPALWPSVAAPALRCV